MTKIVTTCANMMVVSTNSERSFHNFTPTLISVDGQD